MARKDRPNAVPRMARRRLIGREPFAIEKIVDDLVRDQYQGGATVMTAISGAEVALWDIVGKACRQPVYKLLGGRFHASLPAYANGWYGGAATPDEFAERARDVVARGYSAMKFDPFGTAWRELSDDERSAAVECVAKVREAVGPGIGLMIEFHGRLATSCAIEIMRQLSPYRPAWCEEPVSPEKIELLAEIKRGSTVPIAAGERLMTQFDFLRLINLRAVDVVQMDICHCGGLLTSKKIAAVAAMNDLRLAPHCSIGPVALAAALHFDASTPNFMIQEAFGEFDVPWRNSLVRGWNPLGKGEFVLSDEPGLGLELDLDAIAEHPYVPHAFPSLWDANWTTNLTQSG